MERKNGLFILIMLFSVILSAEVMYEHKAEVYGIWSAANSPYYINGEVIVPPNRKLSIEPGTEIRFKTGKATNSKDERNGVLRVLGILEAVGQEDSFITFTRQGDSGKWGVIVLENKHQSSIFRFCKIEHSQHISNVAGMFDYKGAISLKDGVHVIVANSMIQNNDVGIQTARTSYEKTPFIYMNQLSHNSIAGILAYQSAHLIVEKNLIEASKTGILCLLYANPSIRNNIIQDVKEGIMTYHYSNPKIENNVIKAEAHGILAMNKSKLAIYNTIIDGGKFGVTLDGISDMLFENSIIVNIEYNGINLDNQSSAFVQNSILWSVEKAALFYDEKSKVSFTYSLLEKEEHSKQVEYIQGNIFGKNPQFQDFQNGNYRLICDSFDNEISSPCIDNGNPNPNYHDKVTGWDGGWWSILNDIGAYGGQKNRNWNLPSLKQDNSDNQPFFMKNVSNLIFVDIVQSSQE